MLLMQPASLNNQLNQTMQQKKKKEKRTKKFLISIPDLEIELHVTAETVGKP